MPKWQEIFKWPKRSVTKNAKGTKWPKNLKLKKIRKKIYKWLKISSKQKWKSEHKNQCDLKYLSECQNNQKC